MCARSMIGIRRVSSTATTVNNEGILVFDTTESESYTRPSEWLTLPSISLNEQVIHILVAVFESGLNTLAFRVSGNYTVDFGDGNIINYTANGAGASDFNRGNIMWSGVSNTTLTSYGYRQAIVKITPQSGQTLTVFDINETQATPNVYYRSNVLDIKMGGPSISTLDVRGNHPMLDQFEYVGLNNITIGSSLFSGSNIRKIVQIDCSKMTTMSSMFSGMPYLVSLPSTLSTSACTNMDSMLASMGKLEYIPTMDVSKVTNMYRMFYGSSRIREIPVFNSVLCTNMYQMFNTCSRLRRVAGLDVSAITGGNAVGLFSSCLELWDIPTLNFAVATDLSSLFSSCPSIVKFGNQILTPNVTSMNSMFSNCSRLEVAPTLNTSKVTNMGSMFSGCINLKEIPFMDSRLVTNMAYMANGTTKITEFPPLVTSAVTDMQYMFGGATNLIKTPTNFDSRNVANMYRMFYGTNRIQEIPALDMSSVTSMVDVFAGASELITIPTLNLNKFSGATGNIFSGCYKLKNVDLINTSNITNMGSLFANCTRLETVTISDTSNVNNMASMFNGCYKLKEGPVMNTSKVTTMNSMFNGCFDMKKIPTYVTSACTDMQYMFQSCYNLYFVPTLDTTKVINTYRMFSTAFSNIREVGAFNLSGVTNTTEMFSGMYGLSKSNVYGGKTAISYTYCNLPAPEIVNIFNNLGSVTAATNVNVSFNPGSTGITASDRLIATNKGWTVTY